MSVASIFLSVLRLRYIPFCEEILGDDARVKPGTGDIHRACPGRKHDVRGDGMGVGDVGEVHDWARHAGHPSGGDDGREQAWQRE